MARPVKAEADRRELVIAFRVSAEQFAQLMAFSAATGFSRVSDYVRQVALRRPSAVRMKAPAADPIPFEVADQLRRIGVNLNQLTKLAHFGDIDPLRIDDVLAEIHALLQPLHEAANDRRQKKG